MKDYEELLDNQCAAHPEAARFIRRDAPTVSDVESRFYMSMSPPMSIVIGSMSDDESAAADTHLDKKLLQEFADLSEDVLNKIGRGDVIGQRQFHSLLIWKQRRRTSVFFLILGSDLRHVSMRCATRS